VISHALHALACAPVWAAHRLRPRRSAAFSNIQEWGSRLAGRTNTARYRPPQALRSIGLVEEPGVGNAQIKTETRKVDRADLKPPCLVASMKPLLKSAATPSGSHALPSPR